MASESAFWFIIVTALFSFSLAFTPTLTSSLHHRQPILALHANFQEHLDSSLSLLSRLTPFIQDDQTVEVLDLLNDGKSAAAHIKNWVSDDHDIAWMSALHVEKTPSTPAFISLLAFNGPRNDIPHFMASVREDLDDKDLVHVILNLCPRQPGGWETMKADGTFPEPKSRSAFYERQNRGHQYESYFTSDILDWAESYEQKAVETKKRSIPPNSSGPVCMEMSIETGMGLQLFREAADIWAIWKDWGKEDDCESSVIDAMKIYGHDVKVRPPLTNFLRQQLEGIIPNDPAFLDECFSLHSGPPDLADRSSAMAEAAKTNMEIDHMVEATEKS
mmetsp:Transcript_8094/g.16337  ORF Transcript_8094/g.16337 Transcript_8094/m.16337 type:complete len:332 (+) Transcript_8094:133-1128(+)